MSYPPYTNVGPMRLDTLTPIHYLRPRLPQPDGRSQRVFWGFPAYWTVFYLWKIIDLRALWSKRSTQLAAGFFAMETDAGVPPGHYYENGAGLAELEEVTLGPQRLPNLGE